MRSSVPLVVDLDGTLIRTDSLWEAIFKIALHHPFRLFAILLSLRLGKAKFKSRIAELTELEAEFLPFNNTVLELIGKARAGGSPVVLATASDRRVAEVVGRFLGSFDLILASDGVNNLKGSNKANELVKLYGEKGFDYVGDSEADLPVWKHSARAYVVRKKNLARKAEAVCSDVILVGEPVSMVKMIPRAMRVHQWVKNLLIFVPLILSHNFEISQATRALIAFFSFSSLASATYLLNDLLDIESDRKHPTKSLRPIASGELAIPTAIIMILLCLLVGIALSFLLPTQFLIILMSYLTLTILYSLWLKRIVMLDTIILSCLYSIRLLAGGAVVGVQITYWLLGFSFFVFLCLAIVKRIVEVAKLSENGRNSVSGRGYLLGDLTTLRCMASTSSGCAVLTLALYIGSDFAQEQYRDPRFLILICPLMAYWLGRLLILTDRGSVDDDPIYFAIQDKVSYGIAFLIFLIYLAASYF